MQKVTMSSCEGGQSNPKAKPLGIGLIKAVGITDSSFGQIVFVYKGKETRCRYKVAKAWFTHLPIGATREADGVECSRRLLKALGDSTVSLSLDEVIHEQGQGSYCSSECFVIHSPLSLQL